MVGIQKVGNKIVIMVVVDCFSKYLHVYALSYTLTPYLVAQVFMD
jgi:hypothetical protein